MITIKRYKKTRYWAVWQEQELLAVVCYKKGAQAIKQLLSDLLNKPANDKPSK
jgi:hypothetical protein